MLKECPSSALEFFDILIFRAIYSSVSVDGSDVRIWRLSNIPYTHWLEYARCIANEINDAFLRHRIKE